MSTPFSLGTRILAAGAALLGLLLLVGFLLPGTWVSERSLLVPASPERIFTLLDSPAGWRAWTPWPESVRVTTGPDQGAGSGLAWEDRELGDGSFTIVEAVPYRLVRYRVEVQGGSMVTLGRVELAPEGAGTVLTWREEGDFGANPLMGYWARAMERAQGAELDKGLQRLRDLVTANPAGAPR